MSVEKMRFYDIQSTVTEIYQNPNDMITLRCDQLIVGLLMRGQFKSALDAARIRGAEVEVYETRGLLTSAYALRLTGTGEQLLPTLQYMAAMENCGR